MDSPPDAAFRRPSWHFDHEYAAVRDALARPASGSRGLLLVGSMALFALSMSDRTQPVEAVAILVAVLLVHELGHYVGMRVFGYRDVKMFFIPFFGAAVSGKQQGVEAWKEGVVLLLGPLPGIALACVGAAMVREPSPLVHKALMTLLVINAINLLPLGGFDGSRFLQRVLFSRQRHLEVGFLALAGAALSYLSITRGLWMLAMFGCLGLVTVPFRHRLLRASDSLRRQLAGSTEPLALDEESGRALFLAARQVVGLRSQDKPKLVAQVMDQILEATKAPPGAGATAGLLLAWLAGFAAAGAALVLITRASGAPLALVEYPVPGARIVVSMPAGALPTAAEATSGGFSTHTGGLTWSDGSRAYRVDTWDRGPASVSSEQLMATLLDGPLHDRNAVDARAIDAAGLHGRETWFTGDGPSTCKTRLLTNDLRIYQMTACASKPEPSIDRFIDSLRVVP